MKGLARLTLYLCLLHSTSISTEGTLKSLATCLVASVVLYQGQASLPPTHLPTSLPPSQAPTLTPSPGGIQVIATLPTQQMEIGDYYIYQVVKEALFQDLNHQPFTLEAHEEGQRELPSFVTFNRSTNIFRAYPQHSGSFPIVLTACNSANQRASILFAMNVREKEEASADLRTSWDYIRTLGSYIGPVIGSLIGSTLIICCTFVGCKKYTKRYEKKQALQTKLLKETHQKVVSGDLTTKEREEEKNIHYPHPHFRSTVELHTINQLNSQGPLASISSPLTSE